MFFTHRRILFLGLVGTPYDSLKKPNSSSTSRWEFFFQILHAASNH